MPQVGDFVKTILFDGAREITSDYGPRTTPSVGFHQGWDFALPIGTKLYAPADGIYSWHLDDGNGGQYGRIKRNDGTYDFFFHCSKTIAQNGTIKKGQPICYSGNSGHSTGPHLHWERRRTAYSSSYFNDINSILITNDMATVTYTLRTKLTPEQNYYFEKARPDVPKVFKNDATKIDRWNYDKAGTEVVRDAMTFWDNWRGEVKSHAVTTLKLKEEQKRTKDLEAQVASLTDDLRVANDTIARLENEKDSLSQQVVILTDTNAQLTNDMEKLTKEKDRLAVDLNTCNNKLDECEANGGGSDSWVGSALRKLIEWIKSI